MGFLSCLVFFLPSVPGLKSRMVQSSAWTVVGKRERVREILGEKEQEDCDMVSGPRGSGSATSI